MSLIHLDSIELSLGGRTLFQDLSLRVGERDRIGLVGRNGSGKTSLLRLLSANAVPDRGRVHRSRGLRIAYLPQEITLHGGATLLSFVRNSIPGRAELEDEVTSVEAELTTLDGSREEEALLLAARISELHELKQHFEEQFAEREALRILSGLGFSATDHDRDLTEFSGGWQMRALLAALLFQQPDLLLLDEPTNHLDLPSVAWFGGFLRRFRRAFVLISHDREFLNEHIDRVVSIDTEGVRVWPGNYEAYEKQRIQEDEERAHRAVQQQKERERIEVFVERFRAKATKASVVQSRIRQLEKMAPVEKRSRRRALHFRFPPSLRSGKDVLRVEGLSKHFLERRVLTNVDVRLERGERVAIVGVNGSGKTTLLRMLAGELASDAGTVVWGHQTEVGYYAQHHQEKLQLDETPYREVERRSVHGGATQVRAALGALELSDLDVEKPIGVLSGGEKARVALACLLVTPSNVLLMDEPTNHLDLQSSESLAQALLSYQGTLLFVSHNRSFVRRLATRLWVIKDERLEVYPGTLDEYMSSFSDDATPKNPALSSSPSALQPETVASSTKPVPRTGTDRERRQKSAAERALRQKRLAPIQARLSTLEAEIAAIEKAQEERSALLADPALYKDAERREQVLAAYRKDASTLEQATTEWMYAQEEFERVHAELLRSTPGPR